MEPLMGVYFPWSRLKIGMNRLPTERWKWWSRFEITSNVGTVKTALFLERHQGSIGNRVRTSVAIRTYSLRERCSSRVVRLSWFLIRTNFQIHLSPKRAFAFVTSNFHGRKHVCKYRLRLHVLSVTLK